MNLKAKKYVENQKRAIEEKLKARLALLQEKGATAEAIQRDPTMRKLKAQVRKSDLRLAKIAAEEKLNRDKAQAKVEKLAAEKAAKEKKEAPPEPEKKEKKEKKGKGEPKKEKEGKKKEEKKKEEKKKEPEEKS